MEITADIFRKVDEITGKRLVDVVLDAAHQLGTGMWTSQDALSLHVPTPTIDIAVVNAQPVGAWKINGLPSARNLGHNHNAYRASVIKSSNKPGEAYMPPSS